MPTDYSYNIVAKQSELRTAIDAIVADLEGAR